MKTGECFTKSKTGHAWLSARLRLSRTTAAQTVTVEKSSVREAGELCAEIVDARRSDYGWLASSGSKLRGQSSATLTTAPAICISARINDRARELKISL